MEHNPDYIPLPHEEPRKCFIFRVRRAGWQGRALPGMKWRASGEVRVAAIKACKSYKEKELKGFDFYIVFIQ